MVLSALLLLAGGALALSRSECLETNAASLAGFSACGHHDSLNYCLTHISAHSVHDIQACFVDAGCEEEEAYIEARYTLDRCEEWARAGELRKRYRAFVAPHLPVKTEAPAVARTVDSSPNPEATVGAVALKFLLGREDATSDKSSLECYVTSSFPSSDCPLETSKGKVKTLPCTSIMAVRSECAPGLTCSMDKQGNDVCMELKDALDTAGIIITVVFGTALVLGIGCLTFLSCKDRKEQKRLSAKAEATALARAATKKKRAAEVRTPLMRHQDAGTPVVSSPVITGPPGGNDPFGDQNRS